MAAAGGRGPDLGPVLRLPCLAGSRGSSLARHPPAFLAYLEADPTTAKAT